MNLNFRAWWFSEKKMITDITWIRCGKYRDLIGSINGQTILPISFDKVHVMQSTGLTDNNGVDIFDGDIITVEDDDIVRPVVKYIEGTFCLMSDDTCVGHLADYYQDSEVIGNIYENKDLLEEE